MAIFNPEVPSTVVRPAPSDLDERRFTALSIVAAFPLALLLGTAAGSLWSSGQRGVGTLFLTAAVAVGVVGLHLPYVVIARADGTLIFKALTRTVTTNVSHVEQIGHGSGGRARSSWTFSFSFDGSRVQLNDRGGRMLAGYVIGHNARVEYLPMSDRGR
jgi:hypothetical protein